MKSLYLINILLVFFVDSTPSEYRINDGRLLVTITYAQRNINIYTSASNPSRDPKAWIFWHDPLIVFDSSKDIYQYDKQIHFRFRCISSEFDQLVRQTIITKMHPDVERFALFWIIESLSVNTLIVYIMQQTFLPLSAVYPCLKFNISGISSIECQFQSSSIVIANSIVQKILCGKLKFQFEYYIQSTINPITIPDRLVTNRKLDSLRLNLGHGKYIHQRQGNQLIEKYFKYVQSIDKTIEKVHLEKLFLLAINQTKYVQLDQLNQIWLAEDIESIINHDLFYISFQTQNHVLFHLKNTNSSWALLSNSKQTFHTNEIQTMLFDQNQIKAEWSTKEKRWKMQSLTTHLLSDVLDRLQLILINKQYDIDKLYATMHRAIDCSNWSTMCACQSTLPALVLTSNHQFIRIRNINMNFLSNGFTIELSIRPNVIQNQEKSVQILNFRRQFSLVYQSTGEVSFSIDNSTGTHQYITALFVLPLYHWIDISCVYLSEENQLELYINGEYISNVQLSSKLHPLTNDIIIGQGFLGAVRNLRLWRCEFSYDKVRHLTQINSLFGNETCLIGLWPIANGVGQIVSDLIVNNISRSGTLGHDNNPNLLTNPIWAYVLPETLPLPPSHISTYQTFRKNSVQPIVSADYDGDGFADFAVYRPTTMTWMISSSNDPNILITKYWGLSGDIPVQCNFDGDKFFDYTVFRPSTSQWISHLSSNPYFQYIHKWGKSNDIPCPGDFDGDGKTDFVVYRKGTFYINPSYNPTVQWTKQWGQPGDIPVPNCDFDADGKTDFTVWTPTSGIWSWIPSKSCHLVYQHSWGSPSYDTPFCADFDGDKRSDFGLYRRGTGEWFVIPYRVSSLLITYQWGRPGDIPVAGDYDGDGKGEFALWRPRKKKTFMWEVIPSFMPNVILRKAWGIEGDDVADGDFDGDRRSDLAVFRRSTGFWHTLLVGRAGIQQTKHWGFTVNDTSVAADWDGDSLNDFTIYRQATGYWPGDFDGDGKFDYTVWRPSTGMWFILPSTNPSHIVMSQWGLPGDLPAPGTDFDGDGKTDIAVWRPSTGSWYVLPSSNPVYPFHNSLNITLPLQQLPVNANKTKLVSMSSSTIPAVVSSIPGTTRASLQG
ncbi:hypothetical protein I4U23_015454 [Adineta vaga]|nr:hypothetical protein I4U23_015454 [Adineta vaga]